MHSHIVSAHPDALRRRQAALKGRATARVHAEVVTKAAWWEAEGPKNFVTASSPQHLRDILSTVGSLVVADYFSSWCTACRSLFPKLRQLAENNPDVLFVKVNIGSPDLSDMAQRMGISSLPYFQFYKDGKVATQFTANLLSVNRLRAAISANKDSAAGSEAGKASLVL
ncbi:hypothetical protein WJX73_007533 [Symbiochloris irregularis]|uniref:Thioredoxin domain-containing protein n=1 Tax=Symbiochloris irregularis TaxID=706552 RepID=A0AAW1P546_9CHLO